MSLDAISLADVPSIIKRRKWHILVPLVAVLTVACLVAFFLPPVYRSSAVILIEQPDVPPELVASTITDDVAQRIQAIHQRVATTENLIEIIKKFNLYTEKQKVEPIFTITEAMREDIRLEMISTSGTGKKAEGGQTYAFSVAFDHGNPSTAQRVTNELVSLYLSENLRTRQARASETTEFLAEESQRLEEQIAENEKKLAQLKQQNQGSLPEQLAYNLQIIQRLESEMRTLDQQVQALKEREVYLQSELAQMDPTWVSSVTNDERPAERLDKMRTNLVVLSGRYGADHPDVVKLRREVDALARDVGGAANTTELEAERDRVRSELAVLKERYAETHPDVVKMARQLATLEAEIAAARSAPPTPPRNGSGAAAKRPENPAYVKLQADLRAAQAEMAAIAGQRQKLATTTADLEKKVLNTPMVERDYVRLQRDLDSSIAYHREIKQKQKMAQLGETLETERKGERFLLVEPPQVPVEPIKPPRFAILILGIVLAAGAGIGVAILAEIIDPAVYGPRQIALLTGVSPLVVIPYIHTRADMRRLWRKRVAVAVVSVSIVAATLAYVHYQIVPFDVVWIDLQRQLESTGILPGG